MNKGIGHTGIVVKDFIKNSSCLHSDLQGC
jgi:hypothetical protein